jgi:hypothetical protein
MHNGRPRLFLLADCFHSLTQAKAQEKLCSPLHRESLLPVPEKDLRKNQTLFFDAAYVKIALPFSF